jgi:hypothetical protein
MVYDTEQQRAHSLHAVAAAVWQRCDGRTPVEEIARAAAEALEMPPNDQFVWTALRQLEQIGLMEAPTEDAGDPGLHRRGVLRKIGLAAAAALPFVASVAIPTRPMRSRLESPARPVPPVRPDPRERQAPPAERRD